MFIIFSSSELNDGMYRVASNTKFYHNLLIFFPFVTALLSHMFLMKEITVKCFECTLDGGTEDRSDSMPTTPEGGSDNSCCIDQNTLECNLCVRRSIRIRKVEQGRPMSPECRIIQR